MDDSDTYSYATKTASYTLTVTAARTLAEATAEDLGKIVGADGYIYDDAAAATTAGTSAVAMIAYVNGSNGLAIALSDEGEMMNWSTAKSTCEGKTAVSGAAWLLPSQDQWKAMFKANGGSESSYSGLNTAITNVGGTALQERGYWSSTEADGDKAYIVSLSGTAYFVDVDKNRNYLVRACLAFGGQAEEGSVVSGNVNVETLKVGDIIKGVTGVSGNVNGVKLESGRYKQNGTVKDFGASFTVSQMSFASDGYTISASWGAAYTPVDADGNDGNAWIVLKIDANGPVLGGYTAQ